MIRIPAYKYVYSVIKQKIKDRIYEVGTALPTEGDLEKQFSVSRTTIRRAIGLLTMEGYIKVVQGRGSEVLDVFTTQKLNCITSITETLTAKGYVVTTKGMCIERILASEQVAEALAIPPETSVFRIQRVQCADKVPIAIMCNYIKETCAPELDQYTGMFTSLYTFLEGKYHIVFKDAWEYISAVGASFMEAQILGIQTGAPLLCSKRISSNEQGPFEYGIIKLLADKYEYSVYLSGR
ncbi:MAG: GntR family transcriptional regulator [Clostridia bacterium]